MRGTFSLLPYFFSVCLKYLPASIAVNSATLLKETTSAWPWGALISCGCFKSFASITAVFVVRLQRRLEPELQLSDETQAALQICPPLSLETIRMVKDPE